MKVRISNKKIRELLDIETPKFSKYISPLTNLANQYAGGTRPKIVGQMTELIKEFVGKNILEWETWYLQQKPEAIKTATEMILNKLNNFRNTLNKIDQSVVEEWVRDLVIVKTFIGLRLQEATLKIGADIKKTSYRLSNPKEEAKGIDGYIGNIPVSLKPDTYKSMKTLPEKIKAKIIYYKKIDGGVELDYGNILIRRGKK